MKTEERKIMIDREHVLHIARLARLKLSEEEVEQFSRQLGSILEYVEQLDHAPTDGVDPTSIMDQEHESMRDDVPVPSLPREAILHNGPLVKDNHFAVPKVIGG
jgi:aspartyl-tRNA(Asn)/glutamyl-tRNA(Gln) amidotransferase subunit C